MINREPQYLMRFGKYRGLPISETSSSYLMYAVECFEGLSPEAYAHLEQELLWRLHDSGILQDYHRLAEQAGYQRGRAELASASGWLLADLVNAAIASTFDQMLREFGTDSFARMALQEARQALQQALNLSGRDQ
jgi:hypothetical protein